jgi:C4-dicarboxylate-specific signal transduction histidine kinase
VPNVPHLSRSVIEEVLLLSRREIERNGVTVRAGLGVAIPTVHADRVQLQQVILTLVRNAVEAMVANDGGRRVLTVSSSTNTNYVSVTISDTGLCVSVEGREKLFDPLYTTKLDGLGLGLSLCRKIIAAHGGHLWIEEDTKPGAAFTFTLPHRQLAQDAGAGE